MADTHHIKHTRAILKPDNRIALKAVSDNFFLELEEFGDFKDHVLISQFAFDEA